MSGHRAWARVLSQSAKAQVLLSGQARRWSPRVHGLSPANGLIQAEGKAPIKIFDQIRVTLNVTNDKQLIETETYGNLLKTSE